MTVKTKNREMSNAVFTKAGVNWQGDLREAIEIYGPDGLKKRIINGDSIDIPSHRLKRFFGVHVDFEYKVGGKTCGFHEAEIDVLSSGQTATLGEQTPFFLSEAAIFEARKAAASLVDKFQTASFIKDEHDRLVLSEECGEYGKLNVFYFSSPEA